MGSCVSNLKELRCSWLPAQVLCCLSLARWTHKESLSVQNQTVSSQAQNNVINIMNVLMESQIQDFVLMDCCLRLQIQITSFVIILSMLTVELENVQEPEPNLDARCYRANGFFNHEDPNVCNKYYNCVHGYPHIYDCPPPLIFDEAQGTCVREEQASSFARKCERNATKPNIDGFECPEGETIGPNGIPLAHPSFPHPTSCRKYIVCEFSTTPKELGCTDGLVFDHLNNKCVNPEDGPEDCKCW